MSDLRRRTTALDGRVICYLMLLNILFAPFLNTSYSGVIALFLVTLTLIIEKCYRRAGVLLIQYGFFFMLIYIGTQLTMMYPKSFLIMEISFIGTVGMKILPSLGYLHVLLSISSGELMATLNHMKLPAGVVIGTASVLRFVPALKQTFMSMKRGSRYRRHQGLLVLFIKHPIQSYRYYMVPYISRMIQISDDLAATLNAKGVGLHSKTTSTRQIHFKSIDYFMMFFTSSLYFLMFVGRLYDIK